MFKKILLISILSISTLFASSLSPINIDKMKESQINEYKEGKEKISYKDMIAFLKASNDKNKMLILGVLYSKDSDKPDDYGYSIKADPLLAMKYILKSYEMGNKKALVILSGLILYNDNMAKLDKDLSKAKKYLIQAKKDNTENAQYMLGLVEILRGEYEEGLQEMIQAANNGDSTAQLQVALILQKGIYSQEKNKMVIQPERKLAEYFLNKACHNDNKSEKVVEFCNSAMIQQVSK